MKNITVAQAAKQLGISPHSVYGYLADGRLDGDARAGLVDADSLHAYQVKITSHHAEIVKVLSGDFVLTEQERDILERRARFEKLADIGAARKVTKSYVWQVIERVVRRYTEKNL